MVSIDKSNIFNQIKGGIKREALPKQYQELFDILNTDGNDVLDSTEVTPERLTTIFQDIQKNNPDADIEGFRIQLQNAGQKIKGSRTTINSDGTKTVETVYDDTLETTVYYPDGEIKMRKRDTLKEEVVVDTLSSGNSDGVNLSQSNYRINTSRDLYVDFSPRAIEELRQFTGNEFAQSVDSYYTQIAYWSDRNGDLSHIGQAVNDGVQELISSVSGNEYNTYAELYTQAKENKEKAGQLKYASSTDPNSPYAQAQGINFEQTYQEITGQEYNLEKINNFQQTAIKYNTLTALKQKTEMLNEGIKRVELLYREAQLRQSGIQTQSRDETFDEVFVKTLTEYFDGDEETAANFIAGLSDASSREELLTGDKMKNILKEIKNLTQKRYQTELGGENYDTIKERYKTQYKNVYGVDYIKDDIESTLADGAMTTGTIKMGIVITTSILLGGSSLIANAGKSLATKLSPPLAQQAIKLGMSFGSIAESYGLDLLDAMTSKEGLTEEKHDQILENQKASLPFILFGMYVSGPVGDKVKDLIKTSPSLGKNVLNKAFANSSGFTSEVSADAVFEILTRGGESGEIFGENARGEAFGRIMNMLVGGRNHAAAKNALKGVNIYQRKMPDGSVEYYAQNSKGQVFRTKNPDDIVAGLLATAAEAGVNEGAGTKPATTDAPKGVGENAGSENPTQKRNTTTSPNQLQGINQNNLNSLISELRTQVDGLPSIPAKLNKVFSYLQNPKNMSQIFNPDCTWAEGCERNSQAFALICKELGLEGVETKTGIYTDAFGRAEEHMWTEVTIDGKTLIYDLAQKQALPKDWSPNPAKQAGYKEGEVTSPKSVKDKTSVQNQTETETQNGRTMEPGKRTINESLDILKRTYSDITPEQEQILKNYADNLNDIPEVLLSKNINILNFITLIKEWKPEYKNIPFDKIENDTTLNYYLFTIIRNPNQGVSTVDNKFHTIKYGNDSIDVRNIYVFDIDKLKDTNGELDTNKVAEYLKMLKTETDVPRVLSKLKTFIDKIPDIDDFIAKNPNISLKLIQEAKSSNSRFFNEFEKFNDIEGFEHYLSLYKDVNFLDYKREYNALSSSPFRQNSSFDKYSIEEKNIIINKILEDSKHKQILNLLSCYIEDGATIARIISDNSLLDQLNKNNVDISKLMNNQKTIEPKIRNKVHSNLLLMKTLNPENYNKLISSEGGKQIKTGELSAKVLENLRFDDKIDENYFYNLFEKLETDVDTRIQSNEFAQYDKDVISQIIEMDPSKATEILDHISTASDKTFMNSMLKWINNINKNKEKFIEDNDLFVKPDEKAVEKSKLLDLIKYANQKPELMKKLISLNGSNPFLLHSTMQLMYRTSGKYEGMVDRFSQLGKTSPQTFNLSSLNAAMRFMSSGYGDPKLLNDVFNNFIKISKDGLPKFTPATILAHINQNNINFVKDKLSKGTFENEDFFRMLMLKNIPEAKDPTQIDNIIKELDEFTRPFTERFNTVVSEASNNFTKTKDRKYYQQIGLALNTRMMNTFYYAELFQLKLKNPNIYNKIIDSGFLELIEQGKLPAIKLHLLNGNADLSPEVYADLKLLKEGKSIVPEFKAGTSLDDAFKNSKTGDAVEIGNKMYINDGKQLVEWEMTKEKFLELFPPVQRFTTNQQALGDCYFLASMVEIMQNPKTRAEFYKSFKLDGNDVIVTIKAYEEYGGSVTYQNGKIDLDNQRKHIDGCKGLQMFEQAYARVALREEVFDPLPSLTADTKPQALMQRVAGGRAPIALSEILGLDISKTIDNLQPHSTASLYLTSTNKKDAMDIIKKYADNDKYLLHFGTNPKPNTAAESTILPEYNLVSSHAYIIKGYNPTSQMVTIVNPHNTAVVTEIPIGKLIQHIAHLDLTNIE